MLLDTRAEEVAQLRESIRTLTATLTEIEDNARANDRILLTLHKIALLLIQKPKDWQTETTALLKKQFSVLHCQLYLFDKQSATLASASTRLPAGGSASNLPLTETTAQQGAKRYFHLPLKKASKTIGVLVFASKKADAFPDNAARDFSRRLAELLSAAL